MARNSKHQTRANGRRKKSPIKNGLTCRCRCWYRCSIQLINIVYQTDKVRKQSWFVSSCTTAHTRTHTMQAECLAKKERKTVNPLMESTVNVTMWCPLRVRSFVSVSRAQSAKYSIKSTNTPHTQRIHQFRLARTCGRDQPAMLAIKSKSIEIIQSNAQIYHMNSNIANRIRRMSVNLSIFEYDLGLNSRRGASLLSEICNLL